MENTLGNKNSREQGTVAEQKKEDSTLELFNLTEEQKSELKLRVEEHKGLVRIFIHPMVVESKNGEPLKNNERVFAILARTIFSEKAPPIIILENGIAIESWKLGIEKLSHKIPQKIYLVPTMHDYPYPIVPGKPEPLERDEGGRLQKKDFDYVDEGSKTFVKFLNDLGVKKIMIGGTSLKILDNRLNLCVGNFIEFMKYHSDIELKLSLGTAPMNKSEIKQSRPDLIGDL